ncbi:hypothetical protein PCE1_001123 [Barthelona sp. PCE]
MELYHIQEYYLEWLEIELVVVSEFSSIEHIATSKDESTLAVAEQNRVNLLDLKKRTLLCSCDCSASQICLSDDGSRMAALGVDGRVFVIDRCGQTEFLPEVTFSVDTFTVSNTHVVFTYGSVVYQYDFRQGNGKYEKILFNGGFPSLFCLDNSIFAVVQRVDESHGVVYSDIYTLTRDTQIVSVPSPSVNEYIVTGLCDTHIAHGHGRTVAVTCLKGLESYVYTHTCDVISVSFTTMDTAVVIIDEEDNACFYGAPGGVAGEMMLFKLSAGHYTPLSRLKIIDVELELYALDSGNNTWYMYQSCVCALGKGIPQLLLYDQYFVLCDDTGLRIFSKSNCFSESYVIHSGPVETVMIDSTGYMFKVIFADGITLYVEFTHMDGVGRVFLKDCDFLLAEKSKDMSEKLDRAIDAFLQLYMHCTDRESPTVQNIVANIKDLIPSD